MLAGVAGLGVAYGFTSVLLGLQQQTNLVPRFLDGRIDGRALTFTFVLSLATAVVFSLAPALQLSRPDLVEAIKRGIPVGGGWRRSGLRSILVVTQVALSLVVLIGAGLCVKSLRALQSIDPGLESAKVITASFDLRLNGYTDERGRQFLTQLSDEVGRLPGVEGVSFANIVAFSDGLWISPMSIEGYGHHRQSLAPGRQRTALFAEGATAALSAAVVHELDAGCGLCVSGSGRSRTRHRSTATRRRGCRSVLSGCRC